MAERCFFCHACNRLSAPRAAERKARRTLLSDNTEVFASCEYKDCSVLRNVWRRLERSSAGSALFVLVAFGVGRGVADAEDDDDRDDDTVGSPFIFGKYSRSCVLGAGELGILGGSGGRPDIEKGWN